MLQRARRKACGRRQSDMLDRTVGGRPSMREDVAVVGILGDGVALAVINQTDRYKHLRSGHG
jgi:hypothetical protein